jgi:hypothetical protein
LSGLTEEQAEQIADGLMTLAFGVGISRNQSRSLVAAQIVKLEERVRASVVKEFTGGPGLQLRCAFCGERYPAGTPDHKHAGLEAHIRTCTLHPLGIENRELRRVLHSAKDSLESAKYFDGAVFAACKKYPAP